MVSSELITKFFWVCGINDTEDGEVHCLKYGRVAEDVHEAIERGTGTLLSSDGEDNSDPFENIEGDEE